MTDKAYVAVSESGEVVEVGGSMAVSADKANEFFGLFASGHSLVWVDVDEAGTLFSRQVSVAVKEFGSD